MKRDLDLMREILLFIEEHSPPHGGLDKPLEISGYDRDTVFAHTELLIDEGYIDAKVLHGMTGIHDIMVDRLTNRGHDAIAAARNKPMWQNAKKTAAEQGVSLTLGLMVELVKAEAKKYLGLPF